MGTPDIRVHDYYAFIMMETLKEIGTLLGTLDLRMLSYGDPDICRHSNGENRPALMRKPDVRVHYD